MKSAKSNEAVLRQELAALVVKDGVALGGIAEHQRHLALALAACAVPPDSVLCEADVNLALKDALAQSCRFLSVDHVELRRWLVDTGWVVRDGFGRAYLRTPRAALPEPLRPIAQALAGLVPAAWVEELRSSMQRDRQRRRLAWEARAAQGAA